MGGLASTVLVGTIAGSGIWTTLMSRHPSGVVAPFSMLVAVVGTSAAWLLFGGATPPVELACGVLVVAGVPVGSRPSRRTAPARNPDDTAAARTAGSVP